MMTLGASVRATARMSPKSRSNVSTTLCSWAALATISGSGSRIRPLRGDAPHRGRLPARLARSRLTRPCLPEISRGGALEKPDLFVSQRGSILQRLAYILGLKFRIFTHNVLCGHPVRHEIDHKRDGHPHPADAGAPSHYRRVKRDPIEHTVSLSARHAVRKPMRARRGFASLLVSAPRK